jgi:hypothetical protein
LISPLASEIVTATAAPSTSTVRALPSISGLHGGGKMLVRGDPDSGFGQRFGLGALQRSRQQPRLHARLGVVCSRDARE